MPLTLTWPSTKSTVVSSIAAIKTALADDTLDDIVVADGTYSCANATSELSNSLFFGSSFASRTRPCTIRAQTKGGVTFDGGGATNGLAVVEGAHDITFDGFGFANWAPVSSGVVYVSAAYNLAFKNITLMSTCLGTNSASFLDHGFYLSLAASPGLHDILVEDVTVIPPADTTRLLHSAIQIYGTEAAYNVTVRRLTATAQDGLLIWGSAIHDCLFDTCTFTNCTVFGVRQRYANTGLEYRATHSTGSGTQGYFCDVAVPDNTAPTGTTFTSGTSLS